MAGAAAVRELISDLATLDGHPAPALAWFVPRLRELLDADVGAAYGISVDGGHAQLDFIHLEQAPPQTGPEFARFLSAVPVRFGLFDPVSPQAPQRNRAMRIAEVEQMERKPTPETFRQLLVRCDLAPDIDQLRLLACDGPALLAWVGGFRRGEFAPRDRDRLQSLAPALSGRLALERQLADGAAASHGLAAALEALSTAAFLLTPKGRISHANAAGRAELDRDRPSLSHDLSASLSSSGGPYAITRFIVPGQGEHRLAVRRAPPTDFLSRVSAAAARWRLTPRQTDVLALLARGHSNRTIAAQLHCADRTVELHVSALLSKAGADSRAHLVAKLWLDG